MVLSMIRPLWLYRGFVWSNVQREFQLRYRDSLLGALWTVLNPLANILVFTLIFSQLMRARLPGVEGPFAYSIYLCAGSLTWEYFSEIVRRAQNTFLENGNLIKKISFPKLCLPLIVIANASVNFAIIFGLFTFFLLITGNFPGLVYFGIFPVLAIQVAFSIGLGISLGVLNVFFRDVGQFFGIVLQFWFWLTPIVYVGTTLPESVRNLMKWNPMAGAIAAYQKVLLYKEWPDFTSLVPLVVCAIVFCSLGMILFKQRAGEMVDEL